MRTSGEVSTCLPLLHDETSPDVLSTEMVETKFVFLYHQAHG